MSHERALARHGRTGSVSVAVLFGGRISKRFFRPEAAPPRSCSPQSTARWPRRSEIDRLRAHRGLLRPRLVHRSARGVGHGVGARTRRRNSCGGGTDSGSDGRSRAALRRSARRRVSRRRAPGIVGALYELSGERARLLVSPTRMAGADVPRFAAGAEIVSLPRELVSLAGRALPASLAASLAHAVSRSPRPGTELPSAIYARPSAAEEKHGPA